MEDDYQRYRREQEEAVSNQSGTSAGDVLFTIFPNICSVLLALTLTTLCGPEISRQSRILLEFCITVIPCVLCCTVLSEKVIAISQIFLIVSAANIMSILAWKPKNSFKSCCTLNPNKLEFITNFRALTNIMTAVCILAVDFTCFPRKFVKTETYGYSLMDTGVGLFIMSNALVSREARQIENVILKKPFFEELSKTFKECVPLLVLGFTRYIAIEFLGYQKHVSEYGVHWNFFLTLACVKLFTSVLSKNLSSKYSLLTGLWILFMHEYALSTKDLKKWVLSNEHRNDLLSANREGWVSIPGYVALYLIGIALGRLIHQTYQKTGSQLVFDIKISGYELHIGYTRSMSLTFKLYVMANLAFFATYYCEQYFRISRRLANSGYCLWILTLSTLILTFLLMIDVILECISGYIRDKSGKITNNKGQDDLHAKDNIYIEKTLDIFEIVNENGLLFFLFANVLTGTINMTMKTMRVDEPRSVAIIITYMVVNITFVMLRQKGKQLLNAMRNKN
jgi:phosphatidylinositol glycan class W